MHNIVIYYVNWIYKFYIKLAIQRFPIVYINIQRIRFRNKKYYKNIITKETDIVIEGFPRSANSFSVKAFKFNNTSVKNIATHLHAYPQIFLGIKYEIPILMLIRDPLSCIYSYSSFIANNIGIQKFYSTYNISWLMMEYVFFYTKLKRHKEDILVVKFDDALSDFGHVINRLNSKYNSKFNGFEHNDENVQRIFTNSGKHLSPSIERENIKAKLKSNISDIQSSKYYIEAEEIYHYWISDTND